MVTFKYWMKTEESVEGETTKHSIIKKYLLSTYYVPDSGFEPEKSER